MGDHMTQKAAPMGLDRYEFRRLPDDSGVQVSQDGKPIRLDWDAALDLSSALIEAVRRHRGRS